VRWWLNTDHKAFSVDNSAVSGMDFSALDPNLWMVQWTEGKGEVEFQTTGGENLNGLREGFYDVTPYVGLFQQFLTKVPGLTLDQAKKVQIDLIKQLFESKRQMPYHYPIIAGDYWWDATDGSLFASTAGGLQNATASINQVIAALNSVVAHYNSNFVGIINQNAGYDNVLVGQLNRLVDEINGNIVTPINISVGTINANVDAHNNTVNIENSYGTSLITYINNTVLGSFSSGPVVSVNFGLHGDAGGSPPGINADIAHTALAWANPYTASYIGGISGVTYVGPGSYNTVTAAPYTPLSPVSVANAQWIPLGSSVAVNVTPAEQTAIMSGIAARTNQLFTIKNKKIGEVNALLTIGEVIAYNVLADWPAIAAPPGFKLEAPITTIGGGLTIIGDPSGGGGDFPEAPVNDITYGRRNMAWNPALALSGDVLDGGNF
jgi:hypothetical protein